MKKTTAKKTKAAAAPSPESERQSVAAGASSRKEAQRAAARERAKRARDKRKQKEDPEAFAREQAEAAEKAAKEAAEAEQAAKDKEEKRAKLEAQLTDAIAGTAEAVAEGVQMLTLEQDGPHLGNRRARSIGEAWAPILAPYIEESGMQHLPLILASAGTTGALLQWAGEYREWHGVRSGKLPPAKPPAPAPKPVAAPKPEATGAN